MGTAISGQEPTNKLKQRAKNIDQQLLEYKQSDENHVASQSNVEWDNLIGNKSSNDLQEESINPNNNKLNNDGCIQRLIYIVNKYNNIEKNKDSPYLFIIKLRSYSLIQLINDWVHLKSVYIDNKYENNNFNQCALWDYLNMSLCETEESQDIYTRNLRDKSILSEEGQRRDVYNGFNDSQNIVSMQLLDAIHCMFYHGEPVNNNNNKLIKEKREWEIKCGVGAKLKNVSTMLENIDINDDEDDNKGYNKLIREKQDLLLFGQSFFYWDYYNGDPFFCKPKYQTLKQEILNNKIFNLSELQFNDLLYLSQLWHKSIIGQFCTAYNRGSAINQQYEIEPGLPLTISHIMTILLFTNYDLLRFKYINNGCNAEKEKNQEIGIWYKLLREMVIFYGELTSISHSFYYLCDQHLLFNSFTPQINAPFITTTSLSAARINTAEHGIIIQYKQHSSLNNIYFDISYCSSFPWRDLKLFSYATVLEIRDIFIKNKEFNSIQSQRNYVQSMLLWQRMINGQYYHNLCDFVGKSYQKILMLMMDNELNKLNEENAENGVPKYIQSLFSFIIQNNKEMWIIQSEYEQLSNELHEYLLTLHNNAFKPFTILWNKRLRKTLKKDLIFKFVNEYQWKLDENDLNDWNKLKYGEMLEGPELSLKLNQNDYDSFIFKPNIAKKYDLKGFGGFAIKLQKMPKNFKRILVEWDIHCKEANDFIMCVPSKIMYTNDYDAYSTFNPQLIQNKKEIIFKICIKIKQ